jgi:tRNA(Arg) A34 adenosine deaminase TadA
MDQTAIMRRVIELSRAAVDGRHGGPFGAAVVKDGAIVAEAHNEVIARTDPTAHAELLAVRRACSALGTVNLSGCVLYTNGSPCSMCMASMLWAKLDHVHFILEMKDSEAIGLGDAEFYQELGRPVAERSIVPISRLPLLADEARSVYRAWFEDPARVQF